MPNGYSINQSRLFKLANKRKLAGILGITIKELSLCANTANNYRLWSTKSKYPSKLQILSHKPRDIQEPIGLLRRIQDRLSDLLVRIETPEYLLSAKKGGSYVKNASLHMGFGQVIRIDIKGFYKNASEVFVFRFFWHDLQCSQDIARILTDLICWNGCLPTGSPVSPIISFFAYRPMFDELHALALAINAVMTVWIDDIVFSGDNVNGTLIPKAKIVIKKSGLQGHKISVFNRGQASVVTGVAITADGQLHIPNKRYRKIRALENEYCAASNQADRAIYGKALIGQYFEGSQLDPGLAKKAKVLQADMKCKNSNHPR
ncbi:reverse transcriptase family protein [Thiocystis violascens]|uniref:Reverse transcriptase (RNA-dependent DNA polymerase) n=1 Tax=Thiocystis violascens (strain ATCC 17096 / DSM 198 / 6111) TaxID=765911 RepID=I3Y8A1_THIV6|nr:reverse transcriptase family protein [Thiocystis violascens]AFL73219.1 hypothetical protein Thivi_1193 [Thiocystis violascens DSM 198]